MSRPTVTPGAAIGIMCKAPRPGRTKTRLAATIGREAAAALSACFLKDVAAAIGAMPKYLGRHGYGVYAPAGAEKELRQLLPPEFDLLLQVDCEFGNVLHSATPHGTRPGDRRWLLSGRPQARASASVHGYSVEHQCGSAADAGPFC